MESVPMKTPRLLTDLASPNVELIQALGIGLLAAAFLHVQTATYFPSLPVSRFKFEFMRLTVLANFGNVVLSIIIIIRSLFGNLEASPKIFRFVHFSVLAHAALLLPVIRSIDTWWAPAGVFFALLWTSLAGAGATLAVLNRLRWDARFALVGAAVSAAGFGCAVLYAPDMYGRDLRPLGWYAILVSAIPVLAFLTVFLRRAPVFGRLRPLRYGLAAALFAALCYAVWSQMAANPVDRFGGNLQAALNAGVSEISLSELADFEWDTVEIYGALTEEALSPTARASSDAVSRWQLAMSHLSDFAVFIREGEVVHHELFHIDYHGFYYPSYPHPIVLKREDAVFTVPEEGWALKIKE